MESNRIAPNVDPRVLSRLNCPLEEIGKLCEKFNIIELSVFGSVVRDDFRPDSSDIDFLYLQDPNSSTCAWEFMQFHEKLSELTHRDVDVVSKKWMREDFGAEVLPQARVIYAI